MGRTIVSWHGHFLFANLFFVLKSELCPIEVGMTDDFGQRMHKDAEVDTTETTDGLGTQIAIVLTGKMGEVLVIRWGIKMIELGIGCDAQIDDIFV